METLNCDYRWGKECTKPGVWRWTHPLLVGQDMKAKITYYCEEHGRGMMEANNLVFERIGKEQNGNA